MSILRQISRTLVDLAAVVAVAACLTGAAAALLGSLWGKYWSLVAIGVAVVFIGQMVGVLQIAVVTAAAGRDLGHRRWAAGLTWGLSNAAVLLVLSPASPIGIGLWHRLADLGLGVVSLVLIAEIVLPLILTSAVLQTSRVRTEAPAPAIPSLLQDPPGTELRL